MSSSSHGVVSPVDHEVAPSTGRKCPTGAAPGAATPPPPMPAGAVVMPAPPIGGAAAEPVGSGASLCGVP